MKSKTFKKRFEDRLMKALQLVISGVFIGTAIGVMAGDDPNPYVGWGLAIIWAINTMIKVIQHE